MLQVSEKPVSVLFVTLNADSPDFFTTKIRNMKPKPDDGTDTKKQSDPEPVFGDIRGGCSLADLVATDLATEGYRLVFVRCFGKSATFGFAQGDVAAKFEEGENLEAHAAMAGELKEILVNVKWNGVRVTTRPLCDFAGTPVPGELACSVGALFPKTLSKESKKPSKLRIKDGKAQVESA